LIIISINYYIITILTIANNHNNQQRKNNKMGSGGNISGQITVLCHNVKNVSFDDLKSFLLEYNITRKLWSLKYMDQYGNFMVDDNGDVKVKPDFDSYFFDIVNNIEIQKNENTNRIIIKFDKGFDKVMDCCDCFETYIEIIISKIKKNTNIIKCDGFFNYEVCSEPSCASKIYVDENMEVVHDCYEWYYGCEFDDNGNNIFIFIYTNGVKNKYYGLSWDNNTNPLLEYKKLNSKLNIANNESIVVL
jgi:hypothetical protein